MPPKNEIERTIEQSKEKDSTWGPRGSDEKIIK